MNLSKWHPWFAWHPVKIEGKWYWLKRVERRGWRVDEYDHGYWHWEFRLSGHSTSETH